MPQTKDRPTTGLAEILTTDQKRAVFQLELACGQHPGAASRILQWIQEDELLKIVPVDKRTTEGADAILDVVRALLNVGYACFDNARGG